MAEFIKMPTLGFDMEEGTLAGWLKNVGDPIQKGDVLAEIETDKVTQELAARHDGVLLAVVGDAGDSVPVGALLGIIGQAGEDVTAMMGSLSLDGDGAADEAPEIAAVAVKAESVVSAETHQPTAADVQYPGGVKATPVARRIANDKGVDLTRVIGSGPNGRVRKADVEAYRPAATATIAIPSGPDSTEVPLTRLRKAIARRMTQSATTIPQFYVTVGIEMDAALTLRKQINAALPEGEKVSVNDLIVKACGLALRQYPNLNASFGGDKLIMHNHIHVGTAVAVEGGLLTVVQKHTDTSSLRQIASDNRSMIGRARSGKVQADDISGSTFSVSNLGAFGVDHFIAIINPPESAILAVGSAEATTIVKDGEIKVASIMKATCSADHRVTDGAEVAQFLQALRTILEQPINLMI